MILSVFIVFDVRLETGIRRWVFAYGTMHNLK
jgi:hypothetical protein